MTTTVTKCVRCPYREYADNPLVFEEVPAWLSVSLESRDIVPEFRSEDYWYYVVQTPGGPKDATPDDLIVMNPNGSLDVFHRKAKNFTS